VRREAAIVAGEIHYLGAPCCYGHPGWRFVTNYQCLDCLKQPAFKEKKKLYDVAYRATLPPGKLTQMATEWRKKNPEKRKAIVRKYHRAHPLENLLKVRKRYAAKLSATPAWANADAMRAIYQQARALGLEVDHIVPIKGGTVCGLHCEANLEPISALANKLKGNRWWPDMWSAE
jgi:hypothetical protein